MLELASQTNPRLTSALGGIAKPAAALALLLLAASAGCSPNDDFVDVGDRRNRDHVDGGADADGAVGGGSGNHGGGSGNGGQLGEGDGGDGGALGDGGAFGDGGLGTGDGGREPEIDPGNCSLSDEDDLDIAVPFVEGGFAIAPGPIDFGMAYFRNSEQTVHALDTALVDSSGDPLSPSTILDGYSNIVEVALASSAAGWQVAWTDNSSGAIDLHTALLDDTLMLSSIDDRMQVTDTPMEFERRPVLADVAGNALLAWYGEGTSTRRILSKRIGASGDPVEVVPDSAGHAPIEMALAQIGEEHAAVAWVEEVANRGIWVQPLDLEGHAVGEPHRLTDFAAPGSSVDLVTRADDGGAAAYSVGIDQVNFEVRFRRLADDVSLSGEEVKIISRPLQAKDAGIARLGGGYVIAYRAIPDGGTIRDPQVRLVFMSKEGNLDRDPQGRVITFPVTAAARDGSRVQVEVSVDGQLLIAFVDGSDRDDNVLRVVRRRLDCGL